MDFEFQAVDKARWNDLERFFESKGGPHYCWCMAWRRMQSSRRGKGGKEARKSSLKDYVDRQLPVGLLAYRQSEPIAWCSIAPRETYRSLGGDVSKEDVWSLVCFFVKRPFRNQGLTTQLIREAIQYAKSNGARYVEAYPVDPDSPIYRFMGLVPSFEQAGFQFVKNAGSRRRVMILELK